MSVLAVLSMEAHSAVRFGCACLVLAFAVYQLKNRPHLVRLTHDSNEDIWVLTTSNQSKAAGKLICVGYRSSFLVILVIQNEDTQYHYCPVWVDQLSGSDFSYLHQQLLFNTSAPESRNLKTKLFGESFRSN